MRRRLAALLLAAVALVACSEEATPDQDGDVPRGPDVATVDTSGLWTLRSGHSASGEIEIAAGTRITMEIDGDHLTGSAGCNSYGGAVAVEGDSFEAGGLALSEIGCPPGPAEAEARFVEAIGAVDTIARDGKSLTLTGADTELVFRLVPPVDPKPLTGTVWILDSLVSGATASSPVASAEPARLLLKDDGSFEGTTGCRSFSGTWEVVGDVVTPVQMVFHGNCRKGAEQSSHVIAVLATGFRAERKGDRLTLTSSSEDIGLVYRAR